MEAVWDNSDGSSSPAISITMTTSGLDTASPITEAEIVDYYTIGTIAFYEVEVKNERQEKWTILRRFSWFKMVYDMLVKRGLTFTEASLFTTSPFFAITSWFTKAQDDMEPTDQRQESLNRFLSELIEKKIFQYEFEVKFFAPIRRLATLELNYSTTFAIRRTKTELLYFLDPIRSGETFRPVIYDGEADPFQVDLCTVPESGLVPFTNEAEEILALRNALATLKNKKPSDLERLLTDAYSYRLRDLSKYYRANSPLVLKRVFEGGANVGDSSGDKSSAPRNGAQEENSSPRVEDDENDSAPKMDADHVSSSS